MTDRPLVSIVLPTYNGSRYLEHSIRSCLDQTLKDLELIVVDDCSTDSTPQIIARFASEDPRVRSIRNEKNRRLPGTLNTGFAAARGSYLTWTSDDNMYRPNALAQMLEALEQRPDVGLVYARMSYIDENGQVEAEPWLGGGPPEYLTRCSLIGGCFLYRRQVYEAVGDYAEDLFLVEDWDYWIRIAEKFRLYALDDDLYLYRRHEGSLSHQRREQQKRAIRQLLARHLPNMRWAPRQARAHGFLMTARMAWRFGERRDALALMGRALLCSPTYTLKRFAGEPVDILLKRGAHRSTSVGPGG